MDLSLSGRHALVCGSSQGIGRAIAHELAMLGARVTLLARNAERLREVAGTLPLVAGGPHAWDVADFSRPEEVAAAGVRVVSGECGPVHILINNTGGPAGGAMLGATPDAFLAAFEAHVLCNQLLTQAVVEGMKQAQFGRIVNVISTSVKAPIPNLGVSNTIRGAVASWAKTLAGELGSFGITVNNVLPGYTSTERLASLVKSRAGSTGKEEATIERELMASIPAGRFGAPEEIAAAAAFLCTPAAAYINGINLPVDGGRLPTL